MKKALSTVLICATAMSLLAGYGGPLVAFASNTQAEAGTNLDTYNCRLYGTVTDAGQVVSHMVIDFGDGKKVVNAANDTFTVHATASTRAFLEGTGLDSYGDYDINRRIVKTETDGQRVIVYFDMSEGATLAYTSGARN